jgi:alpha-beta hydrolase superfamily lysophospholipase
MLRRALAALLLALAASLPAGPAAAELRPAECPPGLQNDLTCWRGQDAAGAHLLVARPANWNGRLVTHIFGGPRMAPPGPETTDEDLQRYIEFVREGWAWVSTSRRRAGFGVMRAAEDALSARNAAAALLGPPRLSVLHGQSWGGAVAAKAIEALNAPGPDGRRPWDAALLTSGVLAGPSRAYDMRVDLRVAFQAVCGTHPRAEEAQYPVVLGLPQGSRMTREEVMLRYNACTGADLAPEARTASQRQALVDLAAASRIPEWAIPGHLMWATTVFADIAWNMMDGRSAFDNATVRYTGTSDDAAFNARVARYRRDPAAAAQLAADGDLTGAIAIPVLTLHGIGDTTVFVENEAAYRATLEQAGTAHLLLQVFVDEAEHSKLSPPLYPAALTALADWAETRRRPSVEEVRGRCEAARSAHPGECRIQPGYVPQPWTSRVNPRQPADPQTARAR